MKPGKIVELSSSIAPSLSVGRQRREQAKQGRYKARNADPISGPLFSTNSISSGSWDEKDGLIVTAISLHSGEFL